ncbi:hypothetical protein SKAU_G00217450 [Synaphobranchus kaupii]|uniref:Uncharacterized protein n=1 Tax=Synaphobranchus kaupii TaxID=118154 RepID=A0A9Q1FAK9_SYNKA|nr:hypothetical protein SKAU_G00217450 [Synaphobranchus kaupii]
MAAKYTLKAEAARPLSSKDCKNCKTVCIPQYSGMALRSAKQAKNVPSHLRPGPQLEALRVWVPQNTLSL